MKKLIGVSVYLLLVTTIFVIGYHIALAREFPNTRLSELGQYYGQLSGESTYLLCLVSTTGGLILQIGLYNYREIHSFEKEKNQIR